MSLPIMSLEELCQHGSKVTFEKGDILTSSVAEEASQDFYILESGICALSSISFDGRETTYLYYKPLHFVGFVPLMSQVQVHYYGKKTFSIIAKTPCTAYRIPAKQFQELLAFPSVINLVLGVLTENNAYLLEHFHSSKNEPALVQLCRFILDQVDCDDEGNLVLDTFFTYNEIAHYMGVHSVTVARMMKALKGEQMIDKIGHQVIILDRAKMVKLITEERKIDY